MDTYLHEQFAEIEWTHWWFIARRRILADILGQVLSSDRKLRILDAGCGTGSMVGELIRLGEVTGMDSSDEALAYCRDLFPEQRFLIGDVPDGLPEGENFDLITLLDVVEHIPDDVGALRGIRKSLVPGGLFLCTVPAYQWMWGPHDDLAHHQRRYNKRQLRAALETAGFRVTKISYFNSVLFPVVASVRLLRTGLLRRTEPRSDFVVPSKPVNKTLEAIFAAERFVLRHGSLPFGVSLLALARSS